MSGPTPVPPRTAGAVPGRSPGGVDYRLGYSVLANLATPDRGHALALADAGRLQELAGYLAARVPGLDQIVRAHCAPGATTGREGT
jgi:hypothetical protein